MIVDRGGDGSFELAAGSEVNRGPVTVLTVDATTPLGTYSLGCRLSDPGTGDIIHQDRAEFEVE